jgi:glycosyltransferase involved in cell wall biosynthesis
VSTVDVVIPCYNYARFLRGCVQSVLSQTGVDVRVLIIDDHSSDQTSEVGRALAAADRRVEFRRHDTNWGHIATYNEGLLEWTTADYVVLLSADDLLVPGSLSRAVSIMNAGPNIGMVYGRAITFSVDADRPRVSRRVWTFNRWSGEEWIACRCRAGYNVIASPEVVVRGRVQRAVGGYRTELPHAGDLEMWLRIAAVSDIAYVRGMPQAFYRVHPASMLRSKYQATLVDLQQRKAAFDLFFEHYGRRLRGANRLQQLADRALAREALWQACRAYDRNQVVRCGAMDLVRFATLCHPEAMCESEYAALRRRQMLGSLFCHRTQLFALPAIARRMRGWLLHEHWKREGI